MTSYKSQIGAAAVALLTLFALSQAAVAPAPVSLNSNAEAAKPAQAQGKSEEEKWTPVTGSKEFKVNVADGIQGANQIRYEKWDKGTMTGMFSKPIGDGKHEVVSYVADDKGYRITSTVIVDESELSKIQAGAATTPNKAHVDIQQDGTKTSYTVTPDQIAAPEKAADAKAGEKKQS